MTELRESLPCKICGSESIYFGQVDRNLSCEDGLHEKPIFPRTGEMIPYYRCMDCKFLFTNYFDYWSVSDFNTHIYNHEYHLVDPESKGARARRTADRLKTLAFPGECILDYGCGDGFLSHLLREMGFGVVESYDPFVSSFSLRPKRKFDVVSCVEVLEHVVDPKAVVEDIISFLTPLGIIRFTTHLQPEGLLDLNWWYVGPRNGHISLFSQKSLDLLWENVGFTVRLDLQEGKFLARRMNPV